MQSSKNTENRAFAKIVAARREINTGIPGELNDVDVLILCFVWPLKI